MNLDQIKFNPKLEKILTHFIDVLRINVLMVDAKGVPILTPKVQGYGFNGSCQWGVFQHLGTSEFLLQFEPDGHYLKSKDIFSLETFAIPVGINQGYLIVGPVVLNRPLNLPEYQSIAQHHKVNLDEFLSSLSEIRVLTFNSLKSALDLLFEISQYALKMKAEQRAGAPKERPVFTTLLDLAMAITGAECGSIMLLNKKTKEFVIQVSRGLNSSDFNQNTPIKLGDGIAGLVAQKGTPFVINEEGSNNRIQHLLKKPELKCAVVMPMVSNKRIVGVMNISTHSSGTRLAIHSQAMLKSLTKITSNAMEQAFS